MQDTKTAEPSGRIHLCSATRQGIARALNSDFKLISFSSFEVNGQHRTRYTVQKPNGSKFYHLIGHDTGAIIAI